MIVVSSLAKAHTHTTRYIKHTIPAPTIAIQPFLQKLKHSYTLELLKTQKKYGTFSVVVLRSTYSQLVRAYRFIAVILEMLLWDRIYVKTIHLWERTRR